MSSRKTPGLEAQHDTQLVAVIIDEPDGNSVVGKKWNQNQSDLTTASRYCQYEIIVKLRHKLRPESERGKLRIIFTETIIIIIITDIINDSQHAYIFDVVW